MRATNEPLPLLEEVKLKLSSAAVAGLQRACEARQQQMEGEVPLEEARALINQTTTDLETSGLAPAAI